MGLNVEVQLKNNKQAHIGGLEFNKANAQKDFTIKDSISRV